MGALWKRERVVRLAVGALGGQGEDAGADVGRRDRQRMVDLTPFEVFERDHAAGDRQRAGRGSPPLGRARPGFGAVDAGAGGGVLHRAAPGGMPARFVADQPPELPEPVGAGLPEDQVAVAAARRLGVGGKRDLAPGRAQCGRAGRRQCDLHRRLVGRDRVDRDAVGERVDRRPPAEQPLAGDLGLEGRDDRGGEGIDGGVACGRLVPGAGGREEAERSAGLGLRGRRLWSRGGGDRVDLRGDLRVDLRVDRRHRLGLCRLHRHVKGPRAAPGARPMAAGPTRAGADGARAAGAARLPLRAGAVGRRRVGPEQGLGLGTGQSEAGKQEAGWGCPPAGWPHSESVGSRGELEGAGVG